MVTLNGCGSSPAASSVRSLNGCGNPVVDVAVVRRHCCVLGSCVGSAYMGGQPRSTAAGAVRSARARCCRSDTARSRRRARTARLWHRSARCRPRPPTRERTCSGWPPIGQLPLLSRTSGPPAGVAAPGTPGNASHCRRRTGPRRARHRLRLGAGHRGALDRGWPHLEPRHRRRSCRRGRHRRPRQADHGARCEDHEARCEGRRWVMWPSRGRRARTEDAAEDEDAGSW